MDISAAQKLLDSLNEGYSRMPSARTSLLDELIQKYNASGQGGLGHDAATVRKRRQSVAAYLKRVGGGPPEFLSWIGKIGGENQHSDMFAALLDYRTSPNLGRLLLLEFVRCIQGRCRGQTALDRIEDWLQKPAKSKFILTEREHSLPKVKGQKRSRRIDILITTPVAIIAIENKVYSSESADQTEDYQDYLEVLVQDAPRLEAGGILLSPAGNLPGCSSWGHGSFKDLWASLVLALGAMPTSKRQSPDFVYGLSYLKSLESLLPDLRETR